MKEPIYEIGNSYPVAWIDDEKNDVNPNTQYVIKEADPALERLLREEEEIEHRLHADTYSRDCPICAEGLTEQVEDIQRFEQYRDGLRKKYGA